MRRGEQQNWTQLSGLKWMSLSGFDLFCLENRLASVGLHRSSLAASLTDGGKTAIFWSMAEIPPKSKIVTPTPRSVAGSRRLRLGVAGSSCHRSQMPVFSQRFVTYWTLWDRQRQDFNG